MNYRAEPPTDAADRSLSCMQRPLNFNVLETRIRRKSLIKSAGKVIRLFSKLGLLYRPTLNFISDLLYVCIVWDEFSFLIFSGWSNINRSERCYFSVCLTMQVDNPSL